MELLANLQLGFRRRADAAERPVLLPRRPARHPDRRVARYRPGGNHRDAAAGHVRAAAGVGAHHARRHLLRRAVRRFDHCDPGESSRRVLLGRDLSRRLRDGAAGPCRPGAGGRRARLVFRRDGRHADPRHVCTAACRNRVQVRACRILFADGAGSDRRDRAGARLAASRPSP